MRGAGLRAFWLEPIFLRGEDSRGVGVIAEHALLVGERIDAFIETYKSLCAEASEPILSRSALTMRAVLEFAPYMTIVELVNDDAWIIRLNGTGHTDYAQLDRTGRNALATCTPEERTMRRQIARTMFAAPCGLRAKLIETFTDGEKSVLDSTSLPLLGSQGEQMIVTYGLLVEDISEPYGERAKLSSMSVTEHEFVDLGYGVTAE